MSRRSARSLTSRASLPRYASNSMRSAAEIPIAPGSLRGELLMAARLPGAQRLHHAGEAQSNAKRCKAEGHV
jgi:hypothetical protein